MARTRVLRIRIFTNWFNRFSDKSTIVKPWIISNLVVTIYTLIWFGQSYAELGSEVHLLLLLYKDQQIEQELVLYKWYLYKTNPIYISYIHVYEINLAIFVLCMICFIYNIYAWSNLLESSSAPYFSCFSKNSDNRVLLKLCNKEKKKMQLAFLINQYILNYEFLNHQLIFFQSHCRKFQMQKLWPVIEFPFV